MAYPPILYVEDDDNDVLLFRKAFAKTGLPNSIHVASDGLSAIKYWAQESGYTDRKLHPLPGLIVIDLKMPRMTGFELISRLRLIPASRRLPVVVLSSSNYSTDIHTAFANGANGYLIKPHDPAQLVQWLKDLVRACGRCNFATDEWLSFLGNQPLSDPARAIIPLSATGPFRGALNVTARYAEN